MTSGDLNFPIPPPDFLFIHSVTLKPVLDMTTDPRGVPVPVYDIEFDTPGYLTSPDPTNEDSAGTERIRFDAVCLVSRDLGQVNEATLVRCNDLQLPPALAGTYKVESARTSISHTRLLLVRYTGPWEQNTEA